MASPFAMCCGERPTDRISLDQGRRARVQACASSRFVRKRGSNAAHLLDKRVQPFGKLGHSPNEFLKFPSRKTVSRLAAFHSLELLGTDRVQRAFVAQFVLSSLRYSAN